MKRGWWVMARTVIREVEPGAWVVEVDGENVGRSRDHDTAEWGPLVWRVTPLSWLQEYGRGFGHGEPEVVHL